MTKKVKAIKKSELKEIHNISVRNMTSNSGNDVPNQFVITTSKGRFFQSYQSIIAVKLIPDGRVVLDEKTWDYSVTTGKYRNQFLGCNKAECQRQIDSGEYLLADLN